LTTSPRLPAGGYNLITPIKDQGSCGSCVSFAYMATAEAAVASQLQLKTNTLDFSESRRRCLCTPARGMRWVPALGAARLSLAAARA
jgi:hypothetical protein